MNEVKIRIKIKDFPVVIKWLYDNFPDNSWKVGHNSMEYYSEQFLKNYLTDGYTKYYRDVDRENTIFNFMNNDNAMLFKLVWG